MPRGGANGQAALPAPTPPNPGGAIPAPTPAPGKGACGAGGAALRRLAAAAPAFIFRTSAAPTFTFSTGTGGMPLPFGGAPALPFGTAIAFTLPPSFANPFGSILDLEVSGKSVSCVEQRQQALEDDKGRSNNGNVSEDTRAAEAPRRAKHERQTTTPGAWPSIQRIVNGPKSPSSRRAHMEQTRINKHNHRQIQTY